MKCKLLKPCPKCNGKMFLITTVEKRQYCRDHVGNIFGGYEDKGSDQKIMQHVECKECRTLISDNIYNDSIYEIVDVPNNWDNKKCCSHKYDPEVCPRCAGE
jgi:hypothetical protein